MLLNKIVSNLAEASCLVYKYSEVSSPLNMHILIRCVMCKESKLSRIFCAQKHKESSIITSMFLADTALHPSSLGSTHEWHTFISRHTGVEPTLCSAELSGSVTLYSAELSRMPECECSHTFDPRLHSRMQFKLQSSEYHK